MQNTSEKKRSQFAQKMSEILNHGALNLAIGMGYQLGLFEIMDQTPAPATSAQLAEQSGLSERYIQEWLGVMVCGGIVEMTRDEHKEPLFTLPREHADLLTIRAGKDNIGVYAQEIPLLTKCAMQPVLQGFSTGQGVDYGHYPQFHQFMEQLAATKHRQTLVDKFLPVVADGKLIKDLKSGIRTCDLGCSRGLAVLLMAEAFPASEFTGVDIDAESIAAAQEDAHKMGLTNVHFVQADASELSSWINWHEAFDYITAFDAIHDQSRPLSALCSVNYLLKPDGLFSMVDIAAGSYLEDNISHPMAPFLYTVSLMHCLPVGLVNQGAGLGMMWGREKAVSMLQQSGFSDISVQEIPDDPFNLHFECRK